MMKNLATPERWSKLWARTGSMKDMSRDYDELAARYAERGRFYHNLNHVSACLKEFDSVKNLFESPECAEIAIWFHDAVCGIGVEDNEIKSAELARDEVRKAGMGEDKAAKTYALVLATKHENQPSDGDGMLVADIDIAILGKPARTFATYQSAIRKEYAQVPQEEFDKGRSQVLRFFVGETERSSIFLTGIFKEKYEKQARKNLLRAISKKSKV
jgi:predicted metal-dependent HD superfamily phosphohydrolase